MKFKKSMICLLAFFLLISWLCPVGFARSGSSGGKATININTATLEELVQLPRVGEKVAERIISYRKDNGGFKKVEDLKTVRGVGDKVFEKIRPMISVK